MLSIIQQFLKQGYKLHEVYSMTLDDIELIQDALNVDDFKEAESEEIQSLDKAFPLIFS